MNKNTIIVAVIVVILAISLMSAQLAGDKNLVNGSIDSKPNSTVRQLDTMYLRWAEVTSKSMKTHVSDVVNATRVDNYSRLATIGMHLKRDADASLNQSRYFEISSGLKPSLEEIQKSLEDYIIVGEYIETGGKNRDDKPLMDAVNYAKNASDHMTNASVSVQNYMRTLK